MTSRFCWCSLSALGQRQTKGKSDRLNIHMDASCRRRVPQRGVAKVPILRQREKNNLSKVHEEHSRRELQILRNLHIPYCPPLDDIHNWVSDHIGISYSTTWRSHDPSGFRVYPALRVDPWKLSWIHEHQELHRMPGQPCDN